MLTSKIDQIFKYCTFAKKKKKSLLCMYVFVEIKGEIFIHLKVVRFQMIGQLTNTNRALKLYILFTALYHPFIWICKAQNEGHNFESCSDCHVSYEYRITQINSYNYQINTLSGFLFWKRTTSTRDIVNRK